MVPLENLFSRKPDIASVFGVSHAFCWGFDIIPSLTPRTLTEHDAVVLGAVFVNENVCDLGIGSLLGYVVRVLVGLMSWGGELPVILDCDDPGHLLRGSGLEYLVV